MICKAMVLAVAGAIALVSNAAGKPQNRAKPSRPRHVENPAKLGSPVFANWYVLGETVVFTNGLPMGTTVEGVVCDTSGAERHRSAAKDGVWTWKPDERGFYTVRFETIAADGTRTPVTMLHRARNWNFTVKPHRLEVLGEYTRDRFAVAVSPSPARAPAEAPPKFGFNVSAHDAKPDVHAVQFAIVRLLGMSSFVRYHYFRWDAIEPAERGVRDWSRVDASFADAAKAGYGLDRILVNIYGTPEWLSTGPEVVEAGWHNRRALYPPKDMEPLRDFTKAFCERYPGIRYFEIWNEPHLDGFSVFWKKGTPKQFVDLLKAGYEGVKAADPSIVVVMGGIGMRYLPFYEEFVRLGGVKWYDMMDTHCGYDMRPFRATETRYGAESKPYWEGEWHTVLYNCSNPEPPSEEECAFKMLVNFADLIHTVPGRVTGFGLMCGDKTPETAKWYAKVGGIQQVSGLFRSAPMLEPRFAAYALRCATDLFAGDVKSLGAWRYGDDGSYRAALFSSAAGKVAFVWNGNERIKPGYLPPELLKAAKGARMLDWEGRPVLTESFRPRRMYYILEPDAEALAKGDPLEILDYSTYNFKGYKDEKLAFGIYGKPESAKIPLGKAGACFRTDLGPDGVELEVFTPGTERPKSVRFAIDAACKGAIQDVLEFLAEPDRPLTKTRTPELNGDIPYDYSPANVPLTRSNSILTREADGWRWRIKVWRGDLYPFACTKGAKLKLALVVDTADGVMKWGEGLGKIREPYRFGTLVPTGGGRTLATTGDFTNPFGDSRIKQENGGFSVEATSGTKAAGSKVDVEVVPGSGITFTMKLRGNVPVFVAAWASGGKGTKSERVDAGSYSPKADSWQEFSGRIQVPLHANRAGFCIFSWRKPEARWEVKDFKLVND